MRIWKASQQQSSNRACFLESSEFKLWLVEAPPCFLLLTAQKGGEGMRIFNMYLKVKIGLKAN